MLYNGIADMCRDGGDARRMALTHAGGGPGETSGLIGWRHPSLKELWQQPLPHLGTFDRALARFCGYFLLPRFSSVSGLENVAPEADPFILALNHSSRFEALALPAILVYCRGGNRVHFLADWNFQLIPGVGLLYRRAGAIVVTRKSARPRFLNVVKPLYTHAASSMERARAHVIAGRSVGIFPEGTVNSHPTRLLRGRLGAARLSLETGVPVVPAGIRLSGGSRKRPMLDLAFGRALQPDTVRSSGDGRSHITTADVKVWHTAIMREIARLSGKAWEPSLQEPGHGTP